MGLGTMEIVLIIAVIVLLFGATKLPELARGSGRALRIFKTETKGLLDDDDKDDGKDGVKDADKHPAERELEARNAAAREAEARRVAAAEDDIHEAEIVSEREKRDTA